MPSNGMYACVDCRIGGKNPYPKCTGEGHKVLFFGRKITIPKKRDDGAWRRIANGEYYWDRRKVRKIKNRQGWRQSPEVDLGG